MKSSTQLISAVFHLTPTRTRCDLIINSNGGKSEKIASGLLNPFLAHLKTAQDQIAQGGYSIRLDPDPDSDAVWFTKSTVERFVRFVSTPEVLERVYTIESEMLQIEEAIAIQSNTDMVLTTVEDRQAKSVESIEGSKPTPDTNDEKALVLYKPGGPLPEANGSTGREENSKVQLLRVLETRKTVLQKEQGMAFARAVAAGFDIDHMAPLISFAECFGASRLMDACSRFIDLWKRKHETGQWLEIEAAEAMPSPSDFSSMNASGIMFSNVVNKQKDFREGLPESHGEIVSETNGKASVDANGDAIHPMAHQVPVGHQEYFQGHFPHHMYPPWAIHSPGAVPVFQPYPMQGMPYYQNYPGNSPYFQPQYPSTEESRSNTGQKMGQKRHSMDSRGSNNESETWEIDASRTRSQDDSELEKEGSQSRESLKKTSRSGKKNSGMVVIRNINYITSKKQNSSGSESQSATESESDEDTGDLRHDAPEVKHKNSTGSTKRKGNHTKSMDSLNTGKDKFDGKETDGGHWQAFQNCLLRGGDEDQVAVERGLFTMERDVQVNRRQSTVVDPSIFSGRDPIETQERIIDFHKICGNVNCLPKASDELLISRRDGHSGERKVDVQLTEAGGSRIAYRRTGSDDFIIHGRENQSNSTRSSSDPLAVNEYGRGTSNLDKGSSQNLTDESFIVPFRSISRNQDDTDDRNAIDMDSEFPLALQKADDIKAGGQVNYEPNDLGLMPERGIEKGSIGYDPALDYEMQVHASNGTPVDCRNKEATTDVKKGLKKSEKDRRSKVSADTLEKKKILAATRQGKPSKLSPLEEARARAERLRSFKADLQKVKKEKEEEQIKRLEALKIQRQKRIAARSSSNHAQSPLPSQQSKRQLPTKLSSSSHKGSKFSDSEPGSMSPLQRFPTKTASLGSGDSQKPSKLRSTNSSNSFANGLSRSVSSLPEPKKEGNGITTESKASMARIRRLSEPRMSSIHRDSAMKMQKAEPLSKFKKTDGPESKKVSAIMNLDRTKAATLPELKVRTSKEPSDVIHNEPGAREMTQKLNGSKSSLTFEDSEWKRNNNKISHQSDGEDSPVIEKTVVMLECEKPSSPIVLALAEKVGNSFAMDNHKRRETAEVVSEYIGIHAPASSLTVDGVDREPTECHLQDQHSYKVKTISAKDSPKFSSIHTDEKPYQAPYARVSSMEDPCTGSSEYGKALPTNLEMVTTGAETVKAHVTTDFKNLKLEKIPEALEKPQAKESSKRIRRLLKFGRKNHSSAAESDSGSFNGSEGDDHATNTASSSEVHTLKNLISQDETPTANTTQKSSRHFSLLSPFRSKTSEKKLTT